MEYCDIVRNFPSTTKDAGPHEIKRETRQGGHLAQTGLVIPFAHLFPPFTAPMNIETIYLMTENGRFVCSGQFDDVTIKKHRADESCKLRAGFGDGEPTVVLYGTAAREYWSVAPDPATPQVDNLITTQKDRWTAFSYRYVDEHETLMTLRNGNGGYVTSVDIGRPHELLAASAASADEATRFRVIRFAEEPK